MKNVTILKAGRLGNFLIRLKNALHIAIFYQYNVIIPKHPFLTTRYLKINKRVTRANNRLTDKYNFFYRSKITKIDHKLFNQNGEQVLEIMRKIFVIKNIPPLATNDLVIHIRSGDLFVKKPYQKYAPPPLSYYTKIIEKSLDGNIYLVAEDKKNPCINKLLARYPQIKFKQQGLRDDIKLLLSASNIVISVGTFIPQLLLLHDYVKQIYSPSYGFKMETMDLATKCQYIELGDYQKTILPWKNNAAQITAILNYDSSDK